MSVTVVVAAAAPDGFVRLARTYLLARARSLFKIVLIENNWRVFCHNKSLIRSLSRSFLRIGTWKRRGRER